MFYKHSHWRRQGVEKGSECYPTFFTGYLKYDFDTPIKYCHLSNNTNKNKIGQERLNSLSNLYVDKDVEVDNI